MESKSPFWTAAPPLPDQNLPLQKPFVKNENSLRKYFVKNDPIVKILTQLNC